jgi:hypothetical protein
MILEGGDRQIITERGRVVRLTLGAALESVAETTEALATSASKDPFVISSESRIFGTMSIVASKLGGKEKLLRVEGAQMRRYEERFALLNERSRNWYAPVVYLRNDASGEPIEIGGSLVIITDPLNLRLFLENWIQIGYEVNNYEVVSVLTDAEFDGFAGWAEAENKSIVVDPIFNRGDSGQLAPGFLIRSSGRAPGTQPEGEADRER